jgi:hypothetical protein
VEIPWGRQEICKKFCGIPGDRQEIHQHLQNSKGGGPKNGCPTKNCSYPKTQ